MTITPQPNSGVVLGPLSDGTRFRGAQVLNAAHRSYLEARCIPPEVALSAGFRTVDSAEIRDLLGRRRRLSYGGGIAIPYGDNYWCIRLDEPCGGMKFAYPSGLSTRPYLPPIADTLVWRITGVPIVICEGPVKALALTSAGILSVGLAGATGGGHDTELKRRERQIALHPILRSVCAWAGRQVTVMLDADAATNPTVAAGERMIATALSAAGARVFVRSVPLFPDAPTLGPDDFLRRVGPDEVLKHLSGAARWAPERPRRRQATAAFLEHRMLELKAFLEWAMPVGMRLKVGILYSVYFQKWPQRPGALPISEKAFAMNIRRLSGLVWTRSHGVNFVRRVSDVDFSG